MVPLIEREVVGRRKWIDGAEFIDLLTLAQTSPGPLALNTGVFVGYKIGGYPGAFWAVMGIVVPSFVIILLVALFFVSFRTNPVVEAVFKGMRPAVVALILAPIFNLSKGLGWRRLLLAAAALAATWALGFSPVYLIVAGALGGLIFARYRKRKGEDI